jgi:RES domain-containing protein
MLVYRICRSNYAGDMSGMGAKLYGGRWNRPGVPVLYTSFARSLAVLELLVHFESKSALKMPYSIIKIFVPDELITSLDINLLPKDRLLINDDRLWRLLDDFFYNKNVLALRVPSMVIGEEFNVLLNPNHPFYQECKVQNIEAFSLDERLYLQ